MTGLDLTGFRAQVADRLRAAGLEPAEVARTITTALDEDLRYGPDATSLATLPRGAIGVAELRPREPGVVAGVPVALGVFDVVLDGEVDVLDLRPEGSRVAAGEPVLVVRASVRGLLAGERTALNLLGHGSGVASDTATWVSSVDGTGCVIRDSRKTLPGLRWLEKYAVRCAGGINHRMGLGDAVLIKDNHVLAAGSVTDALRLARTHAGQLACEVEVDDLDQLEQALRAGADEVLLDNFTPQECADAARHRTAMSPETKLEASGGLRLADARAYAESGVDYLAVGAVTHSAPALDIGMNLR